MQIVSGRMCWRHATVRPLKSEAATAAPNEVVIGVVHAIHSSSVASTTQVHHWTDVEIDRDLLLTYASIYWFNRADGGAADVLSDQAHSTDWGAPAQAPLRFSVFGADETVRRPVPAPEGAFWAEHERGLHFPATEVPEELAADIRAFFGRWAPEAPAIRRAAGSAWRAG